MTHAIGFVQAFLGIIFTAVAVLMVRRSVIFRHRQRSWQSVRGKVESVDIRTTMNTSNTINNGGVAAGSRTFMNVEYSYR